MFRTLLISVCLICSATSAKTPVYEDFKLLASDGESGDRFGESVSIDGDTATELVTSYTVTCKDFGFFPHATYKFVDVRRTRERAVVIVPPCPNNCSFSVT